MRSPVKSDCSWLVGRLTYCEGRVRPIMLNVGAIQRPMPALSRSAAVSSDRLERVRHAPQQQVAVGAETDGRVAC